MTIKNSGKFIIQKEKLIIYLFVLSVVFAEYLETEILTYYIFLDYFNIQKFKNSS